MYTMAQPHPFAYTAQPAHPPPPPPPTKQYPPTSSAFSSSAGPDEDWTKISDLAERRRIQNRIAQRNYRKKLKKRLEDLERRAGTSDGASSASGNDKTSSPAKKRTQASKTRTLLAPVKAAVPAPYTPPIRPEEEYLFQPTSYDQRDRSHSPPMFTYSTYPPPPEDMMMSASYGAIPAYRHIQPAEPYPDYLSPPPVPMVLPPMTHYTEAVKRDPSYPATTAAEESYPYMGYTSYIPGVDMGPAGHPSPYEQMPHTPPLSHSYDHSTACSESGSYDYPTTPLSMPGSPGMVQQQL